MNRSARRSADPAGPPAGLAARIASIVGAILVCGAIGWFVVSLNLSDDAVSKGNFDDAVAYDPMSPRAAAASADSKLQKQAGAHEVMTLGREAVENSTLSVVGLRSWGIGAQISGDLPLASKLMGQAAALGWRDLTTQIWLMAAALQANDFPATMQHVDALTRLVGMDPRVENVLDTLAYSKGGRAAFLDMLTRNPVWRSDYFGNEDGIPVDHLVLRAQLLVALRGTASPPTPQEVLNITNDLARGGGYLPAFNLWHVMVGGAPNTINDGGLEKVDGDNNATTPFAWRIVPALGATSTVEAAPDGGHWLHVTNDGSGGGTLARQVIALTPGAHRLSVTAKLPDAAAASVFRLKLTCLSPGGLSFRSMPPRTGVRLDGETLDVTVPNDGTCATQSLELIAQGVDGGHVEAWFDNFSVS